MSMHNYYWQSSRYRFCVLQEFWQMSCMKGTIYEKGENGSVKCVCAGAVPARS